MKISKIVTLALTPVLLAGCGTKSMSRADALKKLESMADHDYEKDLENVKKMTVATTQEIKGSGANDGKLVSAMAIDLENAVMYEHDVAEGAAAEALGAGVETWTFVKEDQLIMAERAAGANVGTYQAAPITEETAQQYALALAGALVSFYGTAVGLVEQVTEVIDALNKTEKIPEGTKETYVDKGEGALSIKLEASVDKQSDVLEAEISNYIVTKMSETLVAEGITQTNIMEFKVGEASYTLPDITNWTPAN